MGNIWKFESIYELQFFNCPACDYKNKSKQEFVHHACNVHPESVNNLTNVSDIDDIVCPWNETDIKEENITNIVKKNVVKINKNAVKVNAVIVQSDDKRSAKNLEENDVEILKDNNITKDIKDHHIKSSEKMPTQTSISKEPEEEEKKPLYWVNSVNYLKEITASKMEGGGTQEVFKCEQCPISFNTERHLKIHTHFLHENTENKEYCDLCNIQFKSITKAMNHFEEVHLGTKTKRQEVREICKFCGKNILERFMKSHIKQTHEYNEERDSHKCDLCGKVIKAKHALAQHKAIIHEGKRYKCDICDYTSTSTSCLKKHIRRVHEGILYQCDQCGRVVTTENALQEHVKAQHENIKEFQCDDCGKYFVSKKVLGNHKLHTHGEKKHVCNSCGMGFTTPSSLKIHDNAVHKGVKNFKCTYCKDFFATAHSLKYHTISKHEHDKKIDCDQCGLKFTRIHILQKHISVVHEGIKDFKCVHCSKPFGRESGLKRHIETVHEGLKRYKCEVCGTAYGQSGDLKRHKKRAHPNLFH